MQYVQAAYQAMARQSYILLDNLRIGFMGTATEAGRLVNEVWDELKDQLPEQYRNLGYINTSDKTTINEQILERGGFATLIRAIHIMQQRLGVTGTTMYEAEETLQGAFFALQGAWSNLVVGLAEDTPNMNMLIDNMMTALQNAAKNAIPRLGIIISNIVSYVPQFLEQARIQLIPYVKDLLNNMENMFNGTFLEGIFGKFRSFTDIVFDFVNNGNLTEFARNMATFLSDVITEAVPYLKDAAIGLIKALPGFITDIGGLITPVVDSLLTAIRSSIRELATGTPLEGIINLLDGLLPTFSEFVNNIVTLFGPAVVQTFTSLNNILTHVIGSFAEMTEGSSAWSNFMTNQESGLPKLIELVERFIIYMWDGLQPVLRVIVEQLPGLISSSIPFLEKLIQTLGYYAEQYGQKIAGMIETVFGGLQDYFEAGPEAWDTFFKSINYGLNKINDWLQNASDYIDDMFGNIETSKDTIDKILSGIDVAIQQDLIGQVSEAFINGRNFMTEAAFAGQNWAQFIDSANLTALVKLAGSATESGFLGFLGGTGNFINGVFGGIGNFLSGVGNDAGNFIKAFQRGMTDKRGEQYYTDTFPSNNSINYQNDIVFDGDVVASYMDTISPSANQNVYRSYMAVQ